MLKCPKDSFILNFDNDIFTSIGIDADSDDVAAVTMGALIGFLLSSSSLINAASSAVNAIIACFAEAPTVFSQN